MRKQCFFSRFSRHFVQSSQKIQKKTVFCELFARYVPRIVRENSDFSRFSWHFVHRSQKMRKNSIFWVFLREVKRKVWENSVFSRFSVLFLLSSEKIRKKNNNIFEFFARPSAKSVRKQCFFYVFRDSLYKVHKKCEKLRFLSFLRDVKRKVLENSAFSRFSRHFVLSSQKFRKTAFFELFARR